jgi:prophage DNA circulation protein
MKKSERAEALAISVRLMSALVSFPPNDVIAGANLRYAIGQYMANFSQLVESKVIGTELYTCFELARVAGATLNSMNNVRVAMFAETPVNFLGTAIVNASILFAFVEQSQIISVMEFSSRIEVDTLMDSMGAIIEEIKINKADSFVSSDYQNFISLSALLIQHLSSTERQLPRVVQYNLPVNYPSLTLANLIYADASRSDELIAENNTVHPAFMQRNIVALSA